MVEVTQADRDAAEAIYPAFLASLKGEDGGYGLAEAFARHRTTSLAAQDVETGWLIEESAFGITYWIALSDEIWPQTKSRLRSRKGRSEGFEVEKYISPIKRAKDSNDALRFARKQDAEAFIALFGKFLLCPKATEHQWIDPAPSLAAQDGLDQKELPEVAAMRFIEILRSDIAASVTILTDNEDANYKSEQVAIEVCAEWTNWRDYRIYGESVLQCLAKAVGEREALSAIRENKS